MSVISSSRYNSDAFDGPIPGIFVKFSNWPDILNFESRLLIRYMSRSVNEKINDNYEIN